MKSIFVCLALILSGSTVFGQWKAQTAETYEKTYRIAYVTSNSGSETLRVLRDMSATAGVKGEGLYDQLTGQIMLNKDIGGESTVENIVFRFDDSPKIYIHQPAANRQKWDVNNRKYIIESDWQTWRLGDTRERGVRKAPADAATIAKDESIRMKEILELLKTSKKVSCQIFLLNKAYETQSTIVCEFTLVNSTKSINYLFQ
jgi:restriction endonuclease